MKQIIVSITLGTLFALVGSLIDNLSLITHPAYWALYGFTTCALFCSFIIKNNEEKTNEN